MVPCQSLTPVVHPDSRILILGSMPGVESLRCQQYYAYKRNHFWPILAAVFEVPLPETYPERLRLLQNHGIALWDVIGSCERAGSSDGRIRKAVVNDIPGLLRNAPAIGRIILNGTRADLEFRRAFGTGGSILAEVCRAPSTSPVPGRNVLNYAEKLQVWRLLLTVSG